VVASTVPEQVSPKYHA
jgi:hypothetical protein